MTQKSEFRIQQGTTQSNPDAYIEVTRGGPYRVHGDLSLRVETITPNDKGHSWDYQPGQTFAIKDGSMLCRCGLSKKKPFCDGSHMKADFDLAETASFEPMLNEAEEIDGPRVSLTDNEKFCAYARFCDNGHRIWNEVQMAGEAHEELSTYMAHHCPSGRLIVWDRTTGQPIEQAEPAALALIEDQALGVSGPLLLRGGVRVESANGESYEIRNRQTLCRCGQSSNKPFCDGTHASMRFKDGL